MPHENVYFLLIPACHADVEESNISASELLQNYYHDSILTQQIKTVLTGGSILSPLSSSPW